MHPQRRLVLLPLFTLLVGLALAASWPRPARGAAPDFLIGPTDFGIAWINSAENNRSATRIQRGITAGARLDRFPIYWGAAEPSPGSFTFSGPDAALAANEAQGLGTLAILLGTPAQYASLSHGALRPVEAPRVGGGPLRDWHQGLNSAGSCTHGQPAPVRLYEPIFSDGSDMPGAGKSINPNNPWARFVATTVDRYKPGGLAGRNVRYWEIWNEQDLCHFWAGTPTEYARLLKVAFLTIKQRDPAATVMWGGLAHFENSAFLNNMVNALRADPLAAQFGGFFDAAASHQYSDVRLGYTYTARIRSVLSAAGWGDKPIWITESGVPVCGSFPGPDCPSPWRATAEGQAAFIWQNIAYTRIAGNRAPIFFFQLHDDCGNIPMAVPPADAFGLVTNEATSGCTPHTAQPRLAFVAHQLAVQYLSDVELLAAELQEGRMRRVVFYHPATQERRTMVWATTAEPWTARLPAAGTTATLVNLNGTQSALLPLNGEFHIPLPGATNLPQFSGDTYIGGRPFLLVESNVPLPPAAVAATVRAMDGSAAPWPFVSWGTLGGFANSSGHVATTLPQGRWDVAVQGHMLTQGQLVSGALTMDLVLPPTHNALANGFFAAGLAGWEMGGSSPSALEQRPATLDVGVRLAASFVASPGVPGEGGDGGNSTLSQRQVRVPLGQPWLAFWSRVESAETDGGNGSCGNPSLLHDKFEVIVARAGLPADYLWCQEAASGGQWRFLNLSDYAGQEITLIFNVYESSAARRTSVLLDNVLLGQSPTLAEPRRLFLPLMAR